MITAAMGSRRCVKRRLGRTLAEGGWCRWVDAPYGHIAVGRTRTRIRIEAALSARADTWVRTSHDRSNFERPVSGPGGS